jgi:hypothetical protein
MAVPAFGFVKFSESEPVALFVADGGKLEGEADEGVKPGRGAAFRTGDGALDAGGRTCFLRALRRMPRRSWANWKPGTWESQHDVFLLHTDATAPAARMGLLTIREDLGDLLDVPANLPKVGCFRYQARHPDQEPSHKRDVDVCKMSDHPLRPVATLRERTHGYQCWLE